MKQHLAFTILLASSWCLIRDTFARPSSSSTTTASSSNGDELEKELIDLMRSIRAEFTIDRREEATKDILEKIKIINDSMSKPKKERIERDRDNGDGEAHYALDQETFNKLQEIIKQDRIEPNNDIYRHSKRLYEYGPVSYYQPLLSPYMTMMTAAHATYSNRQTPTLPFQIPWPLAPFFPVLIRDPLLTFIQGGNFNNLFEYGQNADVCGTKRAKSGRPETYDDTPTTLDTLRAAASDDIPTREGRAIKKRTIQSYPRDQDVKTHKKIIKNKIINKKPTAHEATGYTDRKGTSDDADADDEVGDGDGDGDLRMPFGDFGWFGNKKPIAPSPGFFINRLKVQRGGVAIAGPGGVATAGRGGTALVGPGGLAFTKPGGLAVAGPAARVVAVSEDTDMNDVISRLVRAQSATGVSARKSVTRSPYHGGAKGHYLEAKKSTDERGLSGPKERAGDAVRLLADVRRDAVELATIGDPRKDHFEEDVGEEGVGVDSPQSSGDLEAFVSGASVADARPVGVSVVGGAGVASSRPHGTALAASGVAISRPVATAIVGIDPAALGLHVNLTPPQ